MLVNTFIPITCLVRQEDCYEFQVNLDKVRQTSKIKKTQNQTKELLAGRSWSGKRWAF